MMPDPSLFHGIAILIDDDIDDPTTTIRSIKKEIEDAGCHVVPLSALPRENSVPNFREAAFFVVDWKLYGKALREMAEGGGAVDSSLLEEQNIVEIVKFLRDLKRVRFAPVFIFTDESVEYVTQKLRDNDLYDDADPSHILVVEKANVTKLGVFNVLTEWMKGAPSVYVLKSWEKAYEKAKNEMFLDFYVKSTLWPMIVWKNFKDDSVSPAVLMGELIGRNLVSRMTPFDCDLEPFAELLTGVDKNPKAYETMVRKVLEGERFLANERLDQGSFEPGDIFHTDDGYRINIRPDCDCIPRGNDKLDKLDLYLLKGTEQAVEGLDYNSEFGLISERDNESIAFPIYDGKAISFKFRKLFIVKWKDLRAKRIGRLLPPYLTRLQQRYSAYLQRPGLNRLPNAAFPAQPTKEANVEAKPAVSVCDLEVDNQEAAPVQNLIEATQADQPSTPATAAAIPSEIPLPESPAS